MENVIFVQHGFSSTTIYHTALKPSEIKELCLGEKIDIYRIVLQTAFRKYSNEKLKD